MPMEQPVLIPVELEPFTFTDLSDYAALGLEPRDSSVQFVRDFARMYRPL